MDRKRFTQGLLRQGLILACAGCLTACSHDADLPANDSRAQAPSAEAAAGQASSRNLPSPAALRLAAAIPPTERYLQGNAYDIRFANRYLESWGYPGSWPEPLYTGISFSPPDTGSSINNCAVGIYAFNNSGIAAGEPQATLGRTDFADDLQGALFIGLANFKRDRWDWFEPDASGSADFGSWGPYVDPASGEIWAAVVLLPGHSMGINYLQLGDPVRPEPFFVGEPLDSAYGYAGRAPFSVDFRAIARAPGNEPIAFDYDFNGDGVFDVLDAPDGVATHVYTQPGLYTCILRVRGADRQSFNITSSFTVAPETSPPPLPNLVLTPDNGNAPLTVTVDASGSTDDGFIVQYEFDLDGDGVYETFNSGPTTVATLALKGVNTIGVRVTDDYQQTAEATATVTLDSGWVLSEATQGTGLLGAAMAGPPGAELPGIVYSTPGGWVQFMQALDASGSSWPAAPLQIARGSAGHLLSLADGRPAVTYSQYEFVSLASLHLAIADDSSGTVFSQDVVIDPDAGAIYRVSSCLLDGRPALATLKTSGANYDHVIGYYEASDTGGTSWTKAGADLISNQTENLSLIGAGSPMQPLLALAWAAPAYQAGVAGLQGGPPGVWAAVAGYAVQYSTSPGLALVAGNPALLFNRSPEAALGYVRALDANGSSWPAAVTSIPLPDSNSFDNCSLVEAGGAVHAAGTRYSSELWYCRSQDAVGGSWQAPMRLVAKSNAVGESVLLASGGMPLIVFSLAGNVYCAHWE